MTSGGDVFGGTQVTFTDVLGDKQFNFFAASVSQYRTLSFSYINLSRRLQYAHAGILADAVLLRLRPGGPLRREYGFIDRDQALATQTSRGGTAFGIYPLNRYARLEMSAGCCSSSQEYNEPELQEIADQYQSDQYGRTLFVERQFMPLGVNFVRETTVFREYGPLAGDTMSLGYEYAPELAAACSRARRSTATPATTCGSAPTACWPSAPAATSWGDFPGYLYFGGNSEMRGYDYL